MSNGPFSPSTQFQPIDADYPEAYDSLTDLLSDGFSDDEVVVVWPDSNPTLAFRRNIGQLRARYEAWERTPPPPPLRSEALIPEWGWRLRNAGHPEMVYRGDEKHCREVAASAPNLFELVRHYVTPWEPA